MSSFSDLNLKDLYDEIIRPFPTKIGRQASQKERYETGQKKDSTLVYGEISFESFEIIFHKIKNLYGIRNEGSSGPEGFLQRPGGLFYDLGSGTGKPCVAAALLHNFERCTGVEILEGLHTVSQSLIERYNSTKESLLQLPSREFHTAIQTFKGDMLQTDIVDWRDADVLFANSTCYSSQIMSKISNIAMGLKKGAFIVTFTSHLTPMSPHFEILDCEAHSQSWGESTVYIMQKKTEPFHSLPEEQDREILRNIFLAMKFMTPEVPHYHVSPDEV